ncbi:MAG: aminotransferase class I/II-fold pyridoxal phosphate-dependent enzyme [Deltaproteobacteria bacterium]|nr:aminotransferase class I/II-fold pyridoxal phosphate-dependent enzyme [Deltaproteobacteria bacterium]
MTDRYGPWRRRLAALAEAGRTRRTRPVTPTGATTALVEGRPAIVACSNDYLGLSWDPAVRAAAAGGGAGASRLVGGTRPVHERLEQALGERFGGSALLFPSTWHANLSVFSALLEAGDLVASDALNHASIIDGLRLGRARRVVVPHGATDRVPPDARMAVFEGLFSMDGDTVDLSACPPAAWLAVDEAHAVGALGPDGRGVAAAQGIRPDVLIGALGKAYGAAGGFVVGPSELRELLVNAGRSFLFTTAPPEPVAAMALAGLARATEALREQLAENTRVLRAALGQLGWRPLGEAHIVPIVVGPGAMELSDRLLDRGVFAPGIRFPTVPAGQERIRLTLSAAHTAEQLARIADAFGPAPETG